MKIYDNKYYQGCMSDSDAKKVLNVLSLKSINNLKQCIYDMPKYKIKDLITEVETYESENGSLDGFSTELLKDLPLGTLRNEQTLAVAFLYYAGSGFLGDSTGLGKTVEFAGVANLLFNESKNANKEFRFCFLTEKTNAGQIRDKLIQFTGRFVGLLESGEKDVLEDYFNKNKDKRYYSIVGSHSLLMSTEFVTDVIRRPFDVIVVDESSVLKNHTSDMYKFAKSLFRVVDRKILLNATPVENNVIDFYNQLALLDSEYLPNRTCFDDEFRNKKKTLYGWTSDGFKNADKFKEAIMLRYLARSRDDLDATYEGNLYKTIYVPLSKVQKKLMTKTSMYRMVSDYPPAVDRNIEYSLENVPKMLALLVLLKYIDVKKDKLLIYCNYKACQAKMLEILNDLGYICVIINGDVKAKDRFKIVEDFNLGVYDILITNTTRGLDLDTCNNSVVYTIDPNPQKMVQFEGRTVRDLDVIGKAFYVLVSMGKEKKFVEEKLNLKIDASNSFTNAGSSLVLNALVEKEVKEIFSMENLDTIIDELKQKIKVN